VGTLLAVLVLCAVCSTRESRLAGAEAAKPIGRVMLALAALAVAIVLVLGQIPR
jgi:hypothetical protein